MPAPFKAKTAEAKANTEAAARRRRRIGQETMARKLREAGWLVAPPEEAPNYTKRQPTQPPANYLPYAERRPVTLPDSLNDLTGPTTGTVTLPHHLNWSGAKRAYDLETPADLASMYTVVLSEAMRTEDLSAHVNQHRLAEAWADLPIPPKVRRLWEERFPELSDSHVKVQT